MGDLVSIVIPVYNGEKYLLRCLESLQKQTYQNLEILVVDDGSKDRTADIAKAQARQDARIRVISRPNGGVSRARNTGIDQASGRWLYMIDGDDYLHPDAINRAVVSVTNAQAQLAIGGFARVYGDGSPPEVHALEKGEVWAGSRPEFVSQMLERLYENLMLRTQNNKLFSLPLIKANKLCYPAGISVNEDIYFCLSYLSLCRRIVCVPGIFQYYWQNDRGESLITRFHPEGVDSALLVLEAMERLLDSVRADEKIRMTMDNAMFFHICGFAGHLYYKSGKSKAECYRGICRLNREREFRRLVGRLKAKGIKNRAAAFLFAHNLPRVYHWLCLIVYHKKKREMA